MSPLIEIPGIVRITVDIEYGRYQQFITIVHSFLRQEKLLRNESDFNNRIVSSTIERTIQDIVNSALVAVKPTDLIRLLEKNSRVEHKNLSEKFLFLDGSIIGESKNG